MKRLAAMALALCGLHCGGAPAVETAPVAPEAGFLEVPAREVTLAGKPVDIAATGRLFYNFQPADADPTTSPSSSSSTVLRTMSCGPMERAR